MAEEKHHRSFAKAVSWRITGTCDTFVISWLIAGQVKWALSIGFGRVKGKSEFDI